MEEKGGNGADNLEQIFEARLTACGRMVAVLDNWQLPKYLTRLWCVYEQFTAQKLDIHVDFTMPKKQGQELVDALEDPAIGVSGIGEKLGAIDCRNAKASYANDERTVKALIEKTCGYDVVNDKVGDRLIEWCSDIVASQLKKQRLQTVSSARTEKKMDQTFEI